MMPNSCNIESILHNTSTYWWTNRAGTFLRAEPFTLPQSTQKKPMCCNVLTSRKHWSEKQDPPVKEQASANRKECRPSQKQNALSLSFFPLLWPDEPIKEPSAVCHARQPWFCHWGCLHHSGPLGAKPLDDDRSLHTVSFAGCKLPPGVVSSGGTFRPIPPHPRMLICWGRLGRGTVRAQPSSAC